jgi:hypothetical protein
MEFLNMGFEEIIKTGDKVVSKTTNPELVQTLLSAPLPVEKQLHQSRFIDDNFGKVSLFDSSQDERYNKYGDLELKKKSYNPDDSDKSEKKDTSEKDKSEKNEKSDKNEKSEKKNTDNTDKTNTPKPTDVKEEQPKPSAIWGGDPNANKGRHKPMEVIIKEDGSAEVIVKEGDTAWDVARRMLEEKGRNAEPKVEPTNREIYDKLQELEKSNGRLGIIKAGDKITISKEDVNSTKKAEKKEEPTKDEKKDEKKEEQKTDEQKKEEQRVAEQQKQQDDLKKQQEELKKQQEELKKQQEELKKQQEELKKAEELKKQQEDLNKPSLQD